MTLGEHKRAYDLQRYHSLTPEQKRTTNSRRILNLKRQRFALALRVKNKPCLDCRRVFPPWMLDFDHREDTNKEASVAVLLAIGRMTPELEHELTKCDLVCPVCHAYRTHHRAGRTTPEDDVFIQQWRNDAPLTLSSPP